MTTKLQDIEHRYADLATKSAEVANDGRNWSEKAGEWEAFEADIKAIEPELKALRLSAGRSDASALGDANPTANADGSILPDIRQTAGKSIGEQVMDSLKGIDTKSKFAGPQVDVKATLTTGGGGAGLIVPEYKPDVTQILFRALTIADLLASGTIDGNTWIYPKESSVTNAAASVGEGGLKPQSDLNVVMVTETLKKVAHILKMSDEMMLDYSGASSYLNNRGVLFLQLAEDDQLLNGPGTGTTMTGLLARSGQTAAQAVGSDTAVDAIFKEMTKIRTTAFLPPDGIVINPADWQGIRLAKDANGQYYGGGPFTGAYGNGNLASVDSLWGLPVVSTPAMAQGTALVGGFKSCAEVKRQGGIRVDTTNSDVDDFQHDIVSVRFELRELLAVYRPAGFGKVTGLPTPT